MLVGYLRVSKADGSQGKRFTAQRVACRRPRCGAALPKTPPPPSVMTAPASLPASRRYPRERHAEVVWKLDRPGRDLRHLVNTVHGLSWSSSSVPKARARLGRAIGSSSMSSTSPPFRTPATSLATPGSDAALSLPGRCASRSLHVGGGSFAPAAGVAASFLVFVIEPLQDPEGVKAADHPPASRARHRAACRITGASPHSTFDIVEHHQDRAAPRRPWTTARNRAKLTRKSGPRQ